MGDPTLCGTTERYEKDGLLVNGKYVRPGTFSRDEILAGSSSGSGNPFRSTVVLTDSEITIIDVCELRVRVCHSLGLYEDSLVKGFHPPWTH